VIVRAQRRYGLPALALLVLAAIGFGLQGLGLPLDRDEGSFATIARGLLAGALPYRDAFDHKGPGIYYVLAAVFGLTHGLSPLAQVVAARVLMLVVNVLSAAVIYALGRRWCDARVGLVAALLWLAFAPVFDGSRVFTEGFAVLPTLLAVWLSLARRSWAARSLGAGALLGAASAFKQTSVLAFPALWLLGANPFALAAGFALPWLAIWGAFAAAHAGAPFLDQVVVANLHYPPQPRGEWWPHMTKPLLTCVLLFAFDVYGLRLAFASAGNATFQRATRGLLALQVLTLLPFATHAYAHYWVQVLPWVVLPAALGAVRFFEVTTPERLRTAATLALAATFAAAFWRPLSDRPWTLHDQVSAAAQIVAAARAGDRITIGPAEPEYYFLSGLPAPTPYLYLLDVDRARFWPEFNRDLASGRFSLVAWFGVCPSAEDRAACASLANGFAPVASDPRTGLRIYRRRD
jgi:hypothetical protein